MYKILYLKLLDFRVYLCPRLSILHIILLFLKEYFILVQYCYILYGSQKKSCRIRDRIVFIFIKFFLDLLFRKNMRQLYFLIFKCQSKAYY